MPHTDRQSHYFVDESQVERMNDAHIQASDALRDHRAIINHSLELISDIPLLVHHRDKEELVVQRLIIRCLNSGASSLKLARIGYYQPAFSMVRDVIETTFLLDLFCRSREALVEWITLEPRKREKRFLPIEVRKRLDAADGNKDSLRAQIYKRLSIYAAHPTPEGFAIISPGMMTNIGPFPDAERIRAVLEELAKHLSYAAVVCGNHLPEENEEGRRIRERFLVPMTRWLSKYMPNAQMPTL